VWRSPRSNQRFTVTGGRVSEIDVLSDPVRLAELDLSALS